jgi:ATPase subunit of ABC transporter with duplicated ATPase domains
MDYPTACQWLGLDLSGGSYYEEDEDEYKEDEYGRYHDDDEDDEYDRYIKQKAHEEAEERKQQEAKQKAHAEGHDFLEGWNITALQQEATKRGLKNAGTKQSLVKILIDDETKKRRRRELKETATPLLDEYVEIIHIEDPHKQHLNGMKAKAIDFSDGMWILFWFCIRLFCVCAC